MADLAQPDETRIEKLRAWLEQRGVDVRQIGHELNMPSPFKEAVKRQPDEKRRLSVTVVLEAGIPTLRWQCWWSRGKTGKAFGGRTAYALSRVTKVSQEEIAKLLDLNWDVEVEKAETTMDKITAILTMPKRHKEARQQFALEQANQQTTAQPYPTPPSFLSLWEGSPLTRNAEALVEGRGITGEIGYQYGLALDCENMQILIPWIDQQRQVRVHQWWTGSGYRFPADRPGLMTKMDAIFGLHLVRPDRPLVVCEGCFTAMSVCGIALGGSKMSDVQLKLIMDTGCQTIVLALDNDSGGFYGTQDMLARLKPTGRKIIPVFCPDGNDWNDHLRKHGFQATMTTLAERIKASAAQPHTLAIVSQYRGKPS